MNRRTGVFAFALLLVLVTTLALVHASLVEHPGWYNANWTYCKSITIDADKVSGSSVLSNFPTLINLYSNSDLAAKAQNDGDDILFTSSDGTTKLAHEIEKFDGSTGKLIAWVNVTSLGGDEDTILYRYYNNSKCVSQQEVENVWDSNFKLVQHLQEEPSGSAPQMKDSTPNDNDGTSGGSMTSADQITGQIDGSLDFDGTNDYVDCGNNESLNISGTGGLLSGYYYRKPITINGSTAGVLTNYQMKIIVYKDSYEANILDEVFPTETEHRQTVFVVQNENAAYSMTGEAPDGTPDDDVLKWTRGEGNPTKVADLDIAVSCGYIVYIPDTDLIYIYGGWKDRVNITDKIQWFNPKDNTTGVCTEAIPEPVFAYACAAYSTVQKAAYTFGGWYTNGSFSTKIFKHDPIAQTFIEIEATVPWQSCASAAVYVPSQDAIYLFGGFDTTQNPTNKIARFNCATETMIQLDAICPDVMTKTMGAFYDSDTKLIVLGGGRSFSTNTFSYTKRIWTFDPKDYSVTTHSCELPASTDDVGGFYNPTTKRGYLLTVPHIEVENHCGADQKYICELTATGLNGHCQGHCQNDFDDIRFTKADGASELDYWRERYVSGEYAVFWVEFDTIPASPNTTTFYIYYGNPDASSGSNGDNTSDYRSSEPTLGAWGNEERLTNAITIEVWLKSSFNWTPSYNHLNVIYKGRYTLTASKSTNKIRFGIYDEDIWYDTWSDTLTPDEWSHIVATYDGEALRIYINGEPSGTSTSHTGDIDSSSGVDFLLMKHSTLPPRFLSGTIDEVMISATARSRDWIKTEYNNQYSPSTFYDVGVEQVKW
jgi:hypothetical protein